MDVIQDDTVPIAECSFTDVDRLRELTLDRIHRAADPGVPRKRLGRGAAAAILLAACLGLSAVTALAAGIAGRLVNWQGLVVEQTETPPEVTLPPEAVLNEDAERHALMSAILEEETGRDLVIVRCGESAQSRSRTVPVASPEEAARLLQAEGSVLTVPLTVPEGFAFTGGWVAYDSAAGYGYTLVSTEERDDGITVERYSAPPEGDLISAYALEFEDSRGGTMYIHGRLTESSDHMGFGLSEEDSMTPIAVDGMDDALLLDRPVGDALYLRKLLPEPIAYADRFSLMAGQAAVPSSFSEEPALFAEVLYQLYADTDALGAEDLPALLNF